MGTPDLYAVFGHPVGHSRSPWIHARFAALTGQSLSYEARDVPPGGFDAALADFLAEGGRGLNITLPHKLAAFAAAARLTPRAQRAGAVNTLAVESAGLLGDNTDGAGLLCDLQANLGVRVAGRRVLLLGAGGAARGALPALLDARPSELFVANRSAAKAVALAAEFAADGPVSGAGLEAAVGPYDLVVNATSASLAGEVPALPDEAIGPATFCYDLVYGTGATPFMRWAGELGAAGVADGIGMLVEQAAESFSLWRGVRPPTAPVLAELRRLLR
ncbi:MAG TPA: shikimate dehydrogenase [Gammaproteobacteria bacterium]|nr:shikimate dehydrogenase [Gammaproteobacteria bacterium]